MLVARLGLEREELKKVGCERPIWKSTRRSAMGLEGVDRVECDGDGDGEGEVIVFAFGAGR